MIHILCIIALLLILTTSYKLLMTILGNVVYYSTRPKKFVKAIKNTFKKLLKF